MYCVGNVETKCVEWTGGTRGHMGYGSFYIGKVGGKDRSIGAHRQSWMFHNGAIPNGMQVLHRCDNPLCVRIDHLFLGTNTDNVGDKLSKGRMQDLSGEFNPKARLKETDVRMIRTLCDEGASYVAVASMYRMTHQNIRFIHTRKTWAHVK